MLCDGLSCMVALVDVMAPVPNFGIDVRGAAANNYLEIVCRLVPPSNANRHSIFADRVLAGGNVFDDGQLEATYFRREVFQHVGQTRDRPAIVKELIHIE